MLGSEWSHLSKERCSHVFQFWTEFSSRLDHICHILLALDHIQLSNALACLVSVFSRHILDTLCTLWGNYSTDALSLRQPNTSESLNTYLGTICPYFRRALSNDGPVDHTSASIGSQLPSLDIWTPTDWALLCIAYEFFLAVKWSSHRRLVRSMPCCTSEHTYSILCTDKTGIQLDGLRWICTLGTPDSGQSRCLTGLM